MYHLRKVRVRKDDVYYVPFWTIHDIVIGILVAELHENSNVVYCIYNYYPKNKNGNKLKHYFDKTVQVMDMILDLTQKP